MSPRALCRVCDSVPVPFSVQGENGDFWCLRAPKEGGFQGSTYLGACWKSGPHRGLEAAALEMQFGFMGFLPFQAASPNSWKWQFAWLS